MPAEHAPPRDAHVDAVSCSCTAALAAAASGKYNLVKKKHLGRAGHSNSQDGEEEPALYKSDSFRMHCMKVVPCNKRYCHDWTTCPFSHPGEKARRRDPKTQPHTGIACPDMKKDGACIRGDACPYAHSVFEYWLHPTRYRTQLCNDGAGCKRRICFFAHSLEELRVPTSKPFVSPEALAAATASAAAEHIRKAGLTGLLAGQGHATAQGLSQQALRVLMDSLAGTSDGQPTRGQQGAAADLVAQLRRLQPGQGGHLQHAAVQRQQQDQQQQIISLLTALLQEVYARRGPCLDTRSDCTLGSGGREGATQRSALSQAAQQELAFRSLSDPTTRGEGGTGLDSSSLRGTLRGHAQQQPQSQVASNSGAFGVIGMQEAGSLPMGGLSLAQSSLLYSPTSAGIAQQQLQMGQQPAQLHQALGGGEACFNGGCLDLGSSAAETLSAWDRAAKQSGLAGFGGGSLTLEQQQMLAAHLSSTQAQQPQAQWPLQAQHLTGAQRPQLPPERRRPTVQAASAARDTFLSGLPISHHSSGASGEQRGFPAMARSSMDSDRSTVGRLSMDYSMGRPSVDVARPSFDGGCQYDMRRMGGAMSMDGGGPAAATHPRGSPPAANHGCSSAASPSSPQFEGAFGQSIFAYPVGGR